MDIERADPVVVRQRREGAARRVPCGQVLRVAQVTPAVLLSELLEAGEESRALAALDRDLRGLETAAQFGARRVDERARQHRAGDRGQHGLLDLVGRAASGAAAERRAAVVAALRAALEVRLPTHARPARAMQQAAQDVLVRMVNR